MVAYEVKFHTKKGLGFNFAGPAGVIRLSADKHRGILTEIGAKVNKKGLEKVVANWAGMVYNGWTAKRIAGKRCGVSGGVFN